MDDGTAEDLVGGLLRFVAEALLLSLGLTRIRDGYDWGLGTLLWALGNLVATVVRLGLDLLLPRACCVALRLLSARQHKTA